MIKDIMIYPGDYISVNMAYNNGRMIVVAEIIEYWPWNDDIARYLVVTVDGELHIVFQTEEPYLQPVEFVISSLELTWPSF